jgi:hypothetical protein
MATDAQEMTDAELDAATRPDGGEAPPEVVEQRRAKGLAAAFDDDDDDLDEDMQPVEEGGKPKAEKDDDKESDDEEKPDDDDEAPEGADAEPDDLHAMAETFGIDVSRFADRDSLEAAVEAMSKMFVTKGEQALKDEEAAEAATAAEPDEKPAKKVDADPDDEEAKPPPKVAKKQERIGKYKLDAIIDSKEDYGSPELIEALAELRDTVAYLNATHEMQLLNEVKREVEQEQSEVEAFFDELTGQSKVWADLFGVGDGATVKKNNPKLFANRQTVFRQAESLRKGLESSGKSTPKRKQLLSTGLNLAFGEKSAEAAREEVAEQMRKRYRGAAPRPTQRSKPSGGGSHLAATMRKLGMKPGGGE